MSAPQPQPTETEAVPMTVTEPDTQADPTTSPGTGRRRQLLLAGVALLLVALIASVVVLTRRDASPTDAAAATTTAAAPATAGSPTAAASSGPASGAAPATPAAPATGATDGAQELPASLPEVALDAPAAVGNGVVTTLPSIEAIQGTATGPGNVNGPALRVTVRIQNGTSEALSLDGVATNMYFGADRTPASPLDDPTQSPFAGTVAPGDTAEAVYVFSVPEDVRNDVTVEVGYEAGAPLLLFRGPVA